MNPTYFTIFPIFMGLATLKLNPKNRFLLISPFLTVAILKKYKTNAKKITNRMLFLVNVLHQLFLYKSNKRCFKHSIYNIINNHIL